MITVYPFVNELKKRRRRGYIITKKAKLNFYIVGEYLILLSILGFLVFVTYLFFR